MQELNSSGSLKQRIKGQIEYYFSAKNLSRDTYLVSIMNTDLFIPLEVIASFKLVKALTSDINEIIESLKDSDKLVLDLKDKLVRPSFKFERNALVLLDIMMPPYCSPEEVYSIFIEPGCAPVVRMEPELGGWVIIFENDEAALSTLKIIRKKMFKGKQLRIHFRIEQGGSSSINLNGRQSYMMNNGTGPLVVFPSQEQLIQAYALQMANSSYDSGFSPPNPTNGFMPQMMMGVSPQYAPLPFKGQKKETKGNNVPNMNDGNFLMDTPPMQYYLADPGFAPPEKQKFSNNNTQNRNADSKKGGWGQKNNYHKESKNSMNSNNNNIEKNSKNKQNPKSGKKNNKSAKAPKFSPHNFPPLPGNLPSQAKESPVKSKIEMTYSTETIKELFDPNSVQKPEFLTVNDDIITSEPNLQIETSQELKKITVEESASISLRTSSNSDVDTHSNYNSENTESEQKAQTIVKNSWASMVKKEKIENNRGLKESLISSSVSNDKSKGINNISKKKPEAKSKLNKKDSSKDQGLKGSKQSVKENVKTKDNSISKPKSIPKSNNTKSYADMFRN